jgi:L-asparaginase
MAGQIFGAREAEKSHTTLTEAFSVCSDNELGAIGANGAVFWRKPRSQPYLEPVPGQLPRVDIVPMYAGADGLLVRSAVQAGARGLIVQAVGAGNVCATMYAELVSAMEAGVAVVVATRVRRGRTQPAYGFLGGGTLLAHAGAVFAGSLSPQKARILLMLAIQKRQTQEQLQALFDF